MAHPLRPNLLRVASGPDERDRGFLCAIRGSELNGTGVPQLAKVPDRGLLAYGHHLCDVATQNGGDVDSQAVRKAAGNARGDALTEALAVLCPSVAQAEAAEEQRRKAENDAFIAAAEKRCASHPLAREPTGSASTSAVARRWRRTTPPPWTARSSS